MEYVSFDMQCLSMEHAKSNRSECKKCREKIDKGEIRISHTIYFDPEHFQRNPHWHHLKCFDLPNQFKNIKVFEIEQGDDITDADRKKIADRYKIELGDSSMIPNYAPKYRKAKAIQEYEDQKVFSKKEFQQFQKARQELSKLDNKSLLALLRKNNQQVTMTLGKEKMLDRAAECKVLGARYPYCRNCGNGNYRLDLHKGIYQCSGYLDDVDWKKCGIYFKSITRDKWVD